MPAYPDLLSVIVYRWLNDLYSETPSVVSGAILDLQAAKHRPESSLIILLLSKRFQLAPIETYAVLEKAALDHLNNPGHMSQFMRKFNAEKRESLKAKRKRICTTTLPKT